MVTNSPLAWSVVPSLLSNPVADIEPLTAGLVDEVNPAGLHFELSAVPSKLSHMTMKGLGTGLLT